MPSFVPSDDSLMHADTLRDVGAWSEGIGEAICDTQKNKDLSPKSRYKTISALNVNGHPSRQDTQPLNKQDERTARTVPPSGYSLSITDDYLSMLT